MEVSTWDGTEKMPIIISDVSSLNCIVLGEKCYLYRCPYFRGRAREGRSQVGECYHRMHIQS